MKNVAYAQYIIYAYIFVDSYPFILEQTYLSARIVYEYFTHHTGQCSCGTRKGDAVYLVAQIRMIDLFHTPIVCDSLFPFPIYFCTHRAE